MTREYSIQSKLKVQKTTKIGKNVILYIFLAIMAIIVIVPFYWMFNVSLQSRDEVLKLGPFANDFNPSLFPHELTFKNYPDAFVFTETTTGSISFLPALRNTLIVAVFSTVIGTIFSILVAFALSRLNFKGRELIFTVLLATMMIPGEMMVLSNYKTVAALGWVGLGDTGYGSFYAMIIPFLISIFHIYMLRQNFKQIPNELYYAAKVDGTSDFKYLVKVMVPMAKSSIVTIVILKLMGTWNAYVWPNLVAKPEYKLVTAWLRMGFKDPAGVGDLAKVLVNLQMAATIIVTVPLLLLFIFFRKYIMSGVSRSGIKG
ncbi:MAG: carbohydrate ABC transporter permease [Acholeplasmatales bacterium]|jgi:multiple sugar transport system permease protein|nr:carbohydrate ABC transporter permease [Acholeplasmatales bacterium]